MFLPIQHMWTTMISEAIGLYQKKGANGVLRAAKTLSNKKFSEYITNKIYFGSRKENATGVLDYDWDNLIILDAARFDVFSSLAPFSEDKIDSRISVGSRTPEFLRRTFLGKRLHDTVYVTSNPQVLKFNQELQSEPVFHKTISLLNQWDAETQTVLPRDVRQGALETAQDHPKKKLIIHFLQPHAPFIGPQAAEIRDRIGRTIGGFDPGRDYTSVDSQSLQSTTYEEILSNDQYSVTANEIRTAYAESLQKVLNSVLSLIVKLEGKTILTADHGELLGEQVFPFPTRFWEHPGGIRHPKLCIVPKVEFKSKTRKSVTSDPPETQNDIDENTIEDRLRALGYQ